MTHEAQTATLILPGIVKIQDCTDTSYSFRNSEVSCFLLTLSYYFPPLCVDTLKAAHKMQSCFLKVTKNERKARRERVSDWAGTRLPPLVLAFPCIDADP